MNEINMNKFGMPKSGVDVMREQMFGGMILEHGPELPELEMPEFGNVAEEPVRIMGGTKKMVDTAKGLVGGKDAEAKWRINGLRSLVLMDRDGYFKDNVAKHPELNYLTPDRVRADKKGFNMLLGGELSRVIGDGDTYGVLNAAIESMPEEERLGAKARLQQCDTEYKAHELLGELWSGLMQRDFDEAKAKHEAEAEKNKERASAALAAVNAELSETWVKKVMSGIGYSPVSGLRSAEALASGAMTQRQLDELEKTSLRAARAFDELMKQMHDDRTYVGQRLYISNKAAENKKKIHGSLTLGKGGVVTDEEIWQQTAHDESSDYKLDRAKIAGLVELMKREDGSIDATAFALFAAACHEAAYGEQAILSSDFWGNFTSALSDWGSESLDFADRVATSAAAETGLMPSGGLLPVPMPTGLHKAAKERQAILFTPDVEKVKGLLARVEDVRRSPAEGMSWVQATLTELGETAGDSAPFLVGSTINPMLGYAAFFPARTNEAIADNYYEGVTNPVAMAYIEGGWDTLAEGLFAKAVGKLPGVSKGLDWVGLKTVSVPAIGKTLGRIQGNAALRVSTNIALESVGELVVENVVAETGTYVTVRGLRALGVNFDEPEWKPFESSWKQMQNSSQTGATVAYCASLGLLGVPANRRAARDFAKSRKFLLEVGLTEGGVAEVQAAHAEYQKSASAALVRKKYHLEKVRAEAGDKAVEEAENKAGRPLEGKAAEKIRTEAGEKAVAEEVEKILTEQQGALDKTMRRVYDRDVLREDPVALKKRMEKRGEKFLEDVEVKLYAESGVRDAVLAEAGVIVGEKTKDGKRKVQFKGEKEGEVKEVEWTDEQLNAYVAMQREGAMIKRMRYFQTRVAGTALAEAEVTEASVKHELVNMRALPARALARMQRNGGKVDYAVMQDLAEDAAEKISGFVAGGMSGAEARAQMSELPGVTLGTLAQSANAFVQRVEELAGTAEGRALGINKPEDAVTYVFRMNRANAPGQSVLLYNKGLASEREVVEDLLESDVVAAVEGEHASTSWEALEGMLRRVEGDLMKHGGGRLFSSKEKASQMAIIEAFSKLGQSYFLLNHGKYQMSAEAHGTIEYVQKKMADAQHLVAMSHAWEAFAKSKEGKAFLKKEGASFEKLLSDAGASVAGHYAAAKFDADAFAAVREAYEGSIVPSLEAAKPVLEQYEAEQKALDRPAAEADVLVVHADESVTGEELKLEPEAVVDDSTGDFVPPPGAEVLVDKDAGGPPPSEVGTPSDSGVARASGFAEATPRRAEAPALGRGLANGAYVLMDGGSVYGVAEVDSIGLSEDVPQFKKKDTAVGRVEADADGTTHELAGGWNANSAPIHVWRRVDGRLEVISGRHRLAHAKKNGVKHIAVRVYDEAAGHDAKWAKLHDVEQNILDNTCNAIDVAYYFRHNPMPLGEAEARGLMPKTKQGEQTAASRMGLHVAAHASDDTFAMLVNGGCTAEDAYMACLVAASAEGQQLALEARAGKKGKKNSWEYVTALVRGAEQLAPADGGGMLDLFGNDESFRESSEKMARYVAAVRAGLKARLNVLQSAGRLNKKESVSKELGVKVKAPKDALRLIERIAMLDAAYERLDYELGIPAKVEAWDGKSAVPTKLDELEAKGTGVSYSFVSAEMDAALNDAEAESFAHAFHEVERSSAVVSSMPGVYVADIKLAKGKMKLSYDELKKEPIAMHDGRMISFTGRGYKEVTSHAADRRVLASFAKMRELASKSLYLGAAPNTQRDIPTKRWINQFHYYLGKANYPEFKEWCALNGKEANETGDAYVLIVVAEGERGDVFYDLDVTSVEEVENNKGVSENLEATRIPNPGRQDSSTPKGRIHRFKEYVNHIDAINAEIAENNEPQETPVTFSMRTKEEPIKKGIGYKVFYQKDGKLYPPMVANPGGEDTPVGVWLDADEGVRAGESKTGRPQVKAGGKGTQGGSGTLAYRPGWHLGKIPYALQFNRKNPVTGERDLFPKDFVWAEVEYAADVDYQDEAMSYGVNKNGKFQHSLAGLPRIPEDGYYEYRTNPNPATDPWIITGAMKVKRVLTRAEVDELVRAAGREPQKVEDSKASFSVIGQKAATWDKYADRAFKGRDDGMLRAEIDASQAKLRCRLKPEAQGQAELIAGYRRLKPEVLYSGAEYERMSRAQRLWQVMQAMLGKDEKLVENEHFERLAGYLRRGMSQEEYLRDLGLGEDAGKQEIKAALEAARDAHKEAMWEQVAKERMSREVFEEALAMRMGTAEERERLVLSEDDWVGLGETLGDILDYPELYRAYPALKDVEMVYRQASGSFVRFKKSGELKGAKILLSVSRTEEMMRGSLLHEVQHLIQVYEDFGFGGTARNVGYIFASLGRAEELSGDSEKDYKRLAGEVEARAVNDRKDMTAAARLATPFNESLEYPGEALAYRISEYEAAMDAGRSVVSFSVIGQKAKTWDKYTSKAFKGRDDGLMRAEIDASKAKIKWEDLQGKNVAAYRKLVAGWENLPEEERKLVEGYAEQAYDYLEESQKLNNVAEDKVPEQYNKIVKLREELKPKREEVRSLLNKLMVEHGGSAGAVLNMENSELDELAMSLWGPYVESKVVKVLDTRPLWNGSMRLADVLDYAELYEAYPELADVEVRYAAMENANGYAMYGYGEREIWINRNLEGEWEKVHSILLHEVQHHIQDIEGFAKGGNPKSVYKQMKETLGYNEWEMKMLARELRWFSALDYAKDYLRSVRRLLKYPNAWKYNGLRYRYWKASLDGADMTRLLVDDIAGRYEEMRKVDELETKRRGHVIKEQEYVLPVVDFSNLAGVERGLAELEKLKPRRSAFRGEAPKKDKKYLELMKYANAAKRMLDKYELEPYELYRRLAGEIEARNVQARRDWTAAQRAAKPFNETLEYPGEALVTFSIQGIIADWNMEVDNFVQNPPVHKSSEWRQDVYVCPTPAVMRMVGAAPLDIVMSHHVLTKVLDKDTLLGNGKTIGKMYPKEPDMGKHKMTVDELRKLPIALTSPVCIAESNRKGSIEVITDMQENGVNVLVAVQLEVVQGSSQYIKVNRIASLYGKEKIEQLVKHPMLYVNTAKAHKWLVDGGLQLPTVPNLIAGSKKRVLTPTDLVKYKFANGLSFSLSGRGMIDAAPLGRMAGEDKMQRLLNYARKEAGRWTRTFGKDTPNARAAEAMGTVSSILASIHKELPPRFRPRVEGHMRYVEVYARLLESGKVRSYGRLSKEQRAAVEAELLEVLQDAKAEADAEYELAKKEALDAAELTGEMAALEAAEEMDVDDEVKRAAYLDRLAKRTADATRRRLLVEAEAKKQQLEADIDALTREFAAEKLAQIASRMLNDAADAVEAYLIDEELGAVDVLMERLAPRKLPNGKYDKGRMSADAYRKFVSYVELMNKSKGEVAEKMVELGLLIAAEEAKSTAERVEDSYVDADKLDRLNDEISAWSIYGGLRGKNLDAVRKGVEALSNFAIYEKNAWSSMLKLQRNRTKRQALVSAQGLGGADEFKVKEAEEQHGKMRQRLKNLGAGLQSIGQMFYGLGGVPEMRALVDESLDALSAGHVALASREKRAFGQLAEYMEAAMGLKTERQRNNWMAALKKKHKTNIYREGELVRHRLRLTLAEAAEWLELSKAERDAKRAEMDAAADKQGVLAENVPYEEDIPLIREELRRIQEEESSAKYVQTVREFRKDAPKEPMVLSKDEALNILLLCEQADYVEAAHENGYTDEVLAKLAEFVGNEVLGFGYAMREVLENNGLAEVYESREGVPFPKVNNYWPGHFDQSARVNEQANALDPTSGGGTRYGMLITRVKHKLKFNLMGASNVFMAALAQQNNYICMGELTAKWRRLLSHNDFAMAMKTHLGVAQFKQFKELIELLDGAGVQESITQQTLSGLLGQFQSAHAMAVLAGSPITLVKQLSAMLNAGAWEGISCSRVLARIVLDRFGGGAIKYGDMLQKDYFKARYRDKRYFTEMMQLGRDANWSVLSAWARGGMRWIEKMDVLTNCASMTALYNITYHDLKKRNEGAADAMTEEEMHAECDRVVRNTLELGAQPLRRTQKSAFAALSRNALVKATCYMGSEALNKLGMTLSMKRRTGGGAKGFLKAWKYLAGVSIAQQVIVMLLDMARNADPVDEDEWAEWLLLNLATGASGLGLLQSVPVLGEVVQEWSGGYVKTGSLGQMIYDFEGLRRSGKKVVTMAADEKDDSWADWAWAGADLGRRLTFLTGAWGGINSSSKGASELAGLLQSLNAMANTVRPVVQAERNDEKRMKAFRKKVEKGLAKARKATREREKQEREAEAAEKKAEREKREKAKRREERLKRL